MAFVMNHNTGTDTPITGVSELSLPRSIPNYGIDWRVQEDEPEKALIVNMNSPVAYPEKFRVSATDIANIYKDSGVSATQYSATKKGVKLYSQLTEHWTVTKTDDATYNVALPVSCAISLQLPQDPAVTIDDVLFLLGRAVSGLFDSGSETGVRLQALLRKSLKPSDM
jgi:hypothetical protein